MNFFFVEGNDHGLKGVSDHVDVDSAGEDLDGDEKGGGDDVVEDSGGSSCCSHCWLSRDFSKSRSRGTRVHVL